MFITWAGVQLLLAHTEKPCPVHWWVDQAKGDFGVSFLT